MHASGNHGHDHYVEFSVRLLRDRLCNAGGNLSPEQVRQIVRLHEPLEAILDNLIEQLNSHQPGGRHQRPADNERLGAVLEQLNTANVFKFQLGRWFSAHPIMPRDVLSWLPTSDLHVWVEGHLQDLGSMQESGRTLQPRQTFPESQVSTNQLRHYALKLILAQIPLAADRASRRESIEKTLRRTQLRQKILRSVCVGEPGVDVSAILRYCRTLPAVTNGGQRFEANLY
jgi:hypothetical protein